MNIAYIWAGKKVRLRPVLLSDWDKFHNNDLDSDNARLCDEIHFPRLEEGTRQWAEHQSANTYDGDNAFLAIETLDGTLIGSICTIHCNPRSGTFKYGISIFRDHWRRGYATDAVTIILRYYFKELRYQKVNAHVYAFNDGSIALQEHLGFVQEGRIRDMIFTNGKHHDEYIYGLTKIEYETHYG
ncbi:Protein N-acetyltransferase, RimJ/RimL family [Paenibacillus catalpae]|uniref:Protein N-acetyltransferase, RimJ/RimL family n=1 Tax=Paenibacillus catalpae TaxID=1045775 RepID=A0A1I1VP20_9BACL|nr:GNAT family protein [Paenibacillus catalpae]SFD84564.1 Protein N-acetyltransferase, RimJ/RimL family [Paenibacillus catalpae]